MRVWCFRVVVGEEDCPEMGVRWSSLRSDSGSFGFCVSIDEGIEGWVSMWRQSAVDGLSMKVFLWFCFCFARSGACNHVVV